MTDSTVSDRERKRQVRKARQDQQERFGLTRSTKIFIGAIVILLALLVSGAITYLTLALNEARNIDRSQDIAISEWSRRYVSLYDQYTNKIGEKPTSLSPSAIDYLIATETSNPSTGAIPGLPSSSGGSSTPPNIKYTVKVNGNTINLTCSPVSGFDPVAPEYNCN